MDLKDWLELIGIVLAGYLGLVIVFGIVAFCLRVIFDCTKWTLLGTAWLIRFFLDHDRLQQDCSNRHKMPVLTEVIRGYRETLTKALVAPAPPPTIPMQRIANTVYSSDVRVVKKRKEEVPERMESQQSGQLTWKQCLAST